jgi:hypothetical protein
LAANLDDHKIDKQLSNHIYIFSGLGADERVFQKLDFTGLAITFIHWVIPHESEKIEDYATRLLSQIKTTKPTLIGLVQPPINWNSIQLLV